MGGDNLQTQSSSEISGGRVVISDWGRSKNQWLAVVFQIFRLNPIICLWVFINHVIDIQAKLHKSIKTWEKITNPNRQL